MLLGPRKNSQQESEVTSGGRQRTGKELVSGALKTNWSAMHWLCPEKAGCHSGANDVEASAKIGRLRRTTSRFAGLASREDGASWIHPRPIG